jgi:glycosyltransferase involved in cell wall biosynthesis
MKARQSLSKRNLIIAAGRLEYEKGFDLLIDSINNIQNVMREQNYKLAIYGEGQERTHLQQQIEQFNLADIISLNPTTKSLAAKLAESKYTVIPSRNEGFGMVILEAMNQGSVVVSFDDIVGPTSIIDNEQNGYLVTQGDVMALSNKLQALLSSDDNNADIVENGYKTVKAYEPNAVYTQFLTMLND